MILRSIGTVTPSCAFTILPGKALQSMHVIYGQQWIPVPSPPTVSSFPVMLYCIYKKALDSMHRSYNRPTQLGIRHLTCDTKNPKKKSLGPKGFALLVRSFVSPPVGGVRICFSRVPTRIRASELVLPHQQNDFHPCYLQTCIIDSIRFEKIYFTIFSFLNHNIIVPNHHAGLGCPF